MNAVGLVADAMISSAIAFSLTTLAHSGQPQYGIFAIFLWLALLFAWVVRRLPTIPLQGVALVVTTILVLGITLLTSGSLSVVLALFGWAVLLIRQYREISDPIMDNTQWWRLLIDLPIAVVLLVINAMASSPEQALVAMLLALTFAVRILALRASEVAYARQNGVSFIASLFRSQSTLLVAVGIALLFLVVFYQQILRLIFDILSPFLWLIAYILEVLFSHLKSRKPPALASHGKPGTPKEQLHPIHHTILNQSDFAWLPYALAVIACLALIYAVWRLRNKTHDPSDPSRQAVITRERMTPKSKAEPAPSPLRQVFMDWVADGRAKQTLLFKRGVTATGLAKQATSQLSASEHLRSRSLEAFVSAYESERYGEVTSSPEQVSQLKKQLHDDEWLHDHDR